MTSVCCFSCFYHDFEIAPSALWNLLYPRWKKKDTGITHTFVEMPRIIKRDYLSCDQLLHTDNIFHFLPSIVFFLTWAQNWASDRNHVHLLAWSLSFKLWHQIKCSSLLKMPFCCCFCRYGDLEKSVWLQSNFSNLRFSGDSSWKDYLLLTNSFPVSILELNDVVLTVNLETLCNDSKIALEFTSPLWGLLSVLHKCKPDIIPS